MKGKLFSVFSVLLITVLYASVVSAGDLEQLIKAHGGIETFKNYGTLEYDMKWTTPMGEVKDHQVIDLNSRKVLITGEGYKLGYDGREAWIEPNMEAFGIPPRFYASTPFYFFGLPFLFADPGVNAESLGTKVLDGKEYDAVKFTFDEGIGDTPDDNYVAYFDKNTKRLEVLHYIVTYPPFTEGKPVEELDRHAAVYEEWQEVDGLLVPKKMSFYEWNDEELGKEPHGSMVFENVTFKKESPESSVFSKPEGAQVDNSHMSQ